MGNLKILGVQWTIGAHSFHSLFCSEILAAASPTFPALCTCTHRRCKCQHASLCALASPVTVHHGDINTQFACVKRNVIFGQRIMLIIKDKTLLLKMKMARAAPLGQKHPHPLAISIYLWQLTFESSFLQTPCLLALMTPFMSCFPPASLTSSLLLL